MTAVGEKLFVAGRLPGYVVSGSVLALVLLVRADEHPHDVGVPWPLLAESESPRNRSRASLC